MMRARGFTLLEVVVAVALFALAMALAYGGLDSVVRARAQLDAEAQRLGQLQAAVGLLERDVRSAVIRPVRDETGRLQPPLLLQDGTLELSRGGYAQGLTAVRAELQRVRWQLDQDRLLRLAFPALDRAGAAAAAEAPQALLEEVQQWRIEALGQDARWTPRWPLPGHDALRLPRALRLQFESPAHGRIERILELPEGAP